MLISNLGLNEIIHFVKPAPIDQELVKKQKKKQGGKKKGNQADDLDLQNKVDDMSINS